MKCRGAYLLALVILAGGSLSAPGEQSEKVFRIGVLSPAERSSTRIFDGFREGLRELGYIEGRNITIEYRLAAGDTSRLPELASELIRLPVDVIVTDGQKSAVVAHEATRTIPIVMGIVGDPFAAGVTGSFAHPGGNATGFTLLSVELSAKRLEVLKEALPTISRMAALWNPASPASHRQATQEGARSLGVELRTIEVATPDEIAGGFAAAVAAGAEGLVVLPDAMFWNHRGRIVALAAQHRIPAIYDAREYADDGGLISYGPNGPDNFRRAAGYVDKILKGANPGDLPIQQPVKFELIVNLKTAKALGLTVTPSILARADEVIE